MASQQKKRKVKQYPEHPDYKFIVVGNPWPATKQGRQRDLQFYCRVTAWLEFMLGQKDLVQSIYSINTRDDIIVALPKGTDILPIIGAHNWNKFMLNKIHHGTSYIFEFNYSARGDPATHQWLEHFPSNDDPRVASLFESPYPFPSWADPVNSCRELALPLPPTRQRTPPPLPQAYEHDQAVQQMSPYELQGPSHEDDCDPPVKPKTQPGYNGDVRVKSEPRDVQRDEKIPANLRAAHNALLQERTEAQDRSRTIKQEYGIKQEDDQKPPRDPRYNFDSDNVKTEPKVKNEPEPESVPQSSLSSGVLRTLVTHGQLYKTDGQHQQPHAGPSSMTTDPRKARFGTKRVKEEEDLDGGCLLLDYANT